METFNYYVQGGLTSSNKPNYASVQFGDGYEQRAKKGINNLLREFNLTYEGTWNNRVKGQETEFEQVIKFLEKHEGYKAFNWTSFKYPNNNQPVKVYCPSWSITYNQGTASVSMQFKETL